MNLRRLLSVAALLVLALGAVSCAEQDYEPRGPTNDSGSGDEPSAPRGEIWQWALGRDIDDPALRPYTLNMKGDAANVQPEGFALHFDTAQRVYLVSLYNDERSLGFEEENTFGAYRGELPNGLSWDMTATDLLETLGEPDDAYTTGYGAELSFTYRNLDGYAVEIMLAARHQRDLPTSPMHVINVGVG
jgi:hypothetical protein